MNLEIATRLVELRKKHGLSQEELADRLGVSRQAVSKWERVEAAPDTDNLIALARLYDVSVDELLNYKPSNKIDGEDAADSDEDAAQADESAAETDNGFDIHQKDDGKSKVHIGPKGIFIQDGDETVDLSWERGIHITSNENGQKKEYHHNRGDSWDWKDWDKDIDHSHNETRATLADGVIFILAVVAYIAAGAVTGMWHPLWLMFLFTPVLSVPFDWKKFNAVFPFLVLGVFLALGMFLNAWHPGWVVFLAIPAYYITSDSITKAIKLSKKEKELKGKQK